MRTLFVALLVVFAAGTVVAIDTEFVPFEQIKGEHWDFQFKFRLPKRVATTDAKGVEHAHWAILYTVTNPNKVAHDFLPDAVMFTDAGKTASDGLYLTVVEKLRKQFRLDVLKNSVQMMGQLKAGEDEAQDGVFVFPEIDPEMDHFKVFVTGLSGEFIVKTVPAAKEGDAPKEVVLRKTMQLEFKFPGDDVQLNVDKIYLKSQKWIWR